MSQRGQSTVLLLLALLPLSALALLGLVFVGARARAEHAERLAQATALAVALHPELAADRSALRARVGLDHDAEVVLAQQPAGWLATVELPRLRLRLPFVGPTLEVPATATAAARATRTADGGVGAVLVDAAVG